MQVAEEYLEAQLMVSNLRAKCSQSCNRGQYPSVLHAWATPGVTETQPVCWKTSDNFEQHLWQAFHEVLKSYTVEDTAHLVPMAMAGNLVLWGTNHCDTKWEEKMGVFLELALSVFYRVGSQVPVEYVPCKSLLWDCIFLGVAFPVDIGVNHMSCLVGFCCPILGH
ncbi:hypothetical protein DSO57_1001981 [Entomophthora muscae]|uniref:Uncharacterized protein n=1 Tax=Entomophthora muscae TaxID=34485 RepID=A0ACC2RP07_9FUNG|nr:hypothetical protein DSO57_1001981 [Entomophthora muscae]